MNQHFLRDKIVVITGASSGIGLACARLFAAQGAKLALAARSLDKLQALQQELPTAVLAIKTDVSKEEDCRKLIEQTVEAYGGIDVLVNNAGISMRAVFKDLDLKVLHQLMEVNFWGCVYCTKYALPYLLERKGSVVGVTSIAGFKGLPARTGYSASKFAMNGFLDTLRSEHLYDGLHVLIFAPGFTASNVRFSALTADGSPQGETPRKEEKMMSADTVARYMLRGLRKRKDLMVLSPLGKAAVLVNKFFPKFVSRMEYKMMKAEPDSPLS